MAGALLPAASFVLNAIAAPFSRVERLWHRGPFILPMGLILVARRPAERSAPAADRGARPRPTAQRSRMLVGSAPAARLGDLDPVRHARKPRMRPATLLAQHGPRALGPGRTLEWVGPGERRAGSCRSRWRRAGRPARWFGRPSTGLRRRPPAAAGAARARLRARSRRRPPAPELGAVLRLALLASRRAAAWLDLEGPSRCAWTTREPPPASSSIHGAMRSSIPRIGRRSGACSPERRGADDRLHARLGRRWRRRTGRASGRRQPRRAPARGVHPSPLVDYRGRLVPSADCQAEFRAVANLRSRGLCTVEMHGYTHVHPELERWRELRPGTRSSAGTAAGPEVAAPSAQAGGRHPSSRPRALRGHFGDRPGSCVRVTHAPGVARASLALGSRRSRPTGWPCVAVVTSLAPWGSGTPSRTRTALGPGCADPAVACFHDRDPAQGGVDWLHRLLARWRSAAPIGSSICGSRPRRWVFVSRSSAPEVAGSRSSGNAARRRGDSFPVLVRGPLGCRPRWVVTRRGPLRLDVESVAGGVCGPAPGGISSARPAAGPDWHRGEALPFHQLGLDAAARGRRSSG